MTRLFTILPLAASFVTARHIPPQFRTHNFTVYHNHTGSLSLGVDHAGHVYDELSKRDRTNLIQEYARLGHDVYLSRVNLSIVERDTESIQRSGPGDHGPLKQDEANLGSLRKAQFNAERHIPRRGPPVRHISGNYTALQKPGPVTRHSDNVERDVDEPDWIDLEYPAYHIPHNGTNEGRNVTLFHHGVLDDDGLIIQLYSIHNITDEECHSRYLSKRAETKEVEDFTPVEHPASQGDWTKLREFYEHPDSRMKGWSDCIWFNGAIMGHAGCYNQDRFGKFYQITGTTMTQALIARLLQIASNEVDNKPRSKCILIERESMCLSWAYNLARTFDPIVVQTVAGFATHCVREFGGLSSQFAVPDADGHIRKVCISENPKHCKFTEICGMPRYRKEVNYADTPFPTFSRPDEPKMHWLNASIPPSVGFIASKAAGADNINAGLPESPDNISPDAWMGVVQWNGTPIYESGNHKKQGMVYDPDLLFHQATDDRYEPWQHHHDGPAPPPGDTA